MRGVYKAMKLKTFYTVTVTGFSLILIMMFNACSSKSSSPAPGGGSAGAGDYQYTRLSPSGGFVSSVAYRPGVASEIWASGDDSSGLFRTLNGGSSWTNITSVPLDHSTYSLTFDPNNNQIVYAPNHFGRGLLKSTDAGTTWQLITTGLPADNNSDERWNDMAIDPNATQTIYAALTGGLYKSTNGGQNFSKITHAAFTANTDAHFRAIKIQRINSSSSQIFLGSEKGRVYKSTDGGSTWLEITTGGYLPVTDLAVTTHALYIAFADGTITKTTTYGVGAFSFVNNATAGAIIESGLWTRMCAVSGASAATDQLYIGTTFKVGSTKLGFFYSADGGATLQKRVTGLDNSSTFSMAVNPANASEVIIGTVNNGIFKTTDKGLNWATASQGVQATDSLAFAEDPTNVSHLLMSSTAGLDGTSKVYETTNSGASWGSVSFFNDKSVRSLLYPSNNANVIVAGTHLKGIYKTTTGVNGAWSQVNTANAIFASLKKDNVNSNVLYASSYEPNGSPDLGGYVSTNAGTSWVKRLSFPVADITSHPTTTGVAVAVTGDVFGTTDSFATSVNSLGMAAYAPGEIFFSAAFVPGTSTLLVGSSAAKLYKTTNFNATGAGVTWQTVTLPAVDVIIKDIVVVDAQTWYLVAFNGDIHVKPTSTPGLLRTTDGGATWQFINNGLTPSRLAVRAYKSVHQSNKFYLGMWGAGLLSLIDN